jgi:colanic acid biosynthesis glycosyl transferase WcaI
MKVAFFTRYFWPEVGAAPELVSQVCEDLVRRGHQVTVIAPAPSYNLLSEHSNGKGGLSGWEEWRGVRIRRVWNFSGGRGSMVRKGLEHVSIGFSLAAGAIDLPRHDVVLGISPPLATGLACHAAARAWGVPFVFNVQDVFPQNAIDLGLMKNRALIWGFEGMERYIYRHASRVTVHSAGNRELLLRHGCPSDRVVEISNWVDTNWIKPADRDNEFRRVHAPDARFLVVFAGTMGVSQDLDVALRCAQRLQQVPGLQFLLVGNGTEKPRLQQEAKAMNLSNVRFAPMQPPEKYPEVLAAADACLATLHPSVLTPVVPSKILTIMAAARPVLAALPLSGDAPALIADARAGIVVPAGDDNALAKAVMELCDNTALAEECGARGRTYVQQYYARELAMDRWEDLLAQVVRNRS